MLLKLSMLLTLVFFANELALGQQQDRQSAVVLDENLWVTFYDLPSRRFRAIRSAVLTRNFDAARQDLAVTATYLAIETDRATAVLQGPLREVTDQLRTFESSIDDVALSDLDASFGRAHWLLAQHYLQFARKARDARQDRNTSLYLWATAHHIERAVLWSDVAVTRDVQKTLEDLREIAGDLQDPARAARAYRERPVVRAENLRRKGGKQIDRRILVALPAAD